MKFAEDMGFEIINRDELVRIYGKDTPGSFDAFDFALRLVVSFCARMSSSCLVTTGKEMSTASGPLSVSSTRK